MDYQLSKEIIVPVSLFLGGIAAGIIVELIILTRLRRLASRTRWKGISVVIGSLRWMALLWLSIIGAYLASLSLADAEVRRVVQQILLAVGVLSATWVLARTLAGFIDIYSERPEGRLPATSIFANLTKLLVFVLGALVLLQTLGISITPMLTALGIGGLAVALALKDTLSNLFAGFQIIASRQVQPGDYVRLESGEEGYVEDVNWRNTHILTTSNNIIVAPNSNLANSIVTNYSLMEEEMSVLVEAGVSYDSDLEQVEAVTLDVARNVMQEMEGAIPDFEPVFRYRAFGDSSIDFIVVLRVREFSERFAVIHEFIKQLHERYNQEGIVIPFPVRTVQLTGPPAED